MLNDFKKYVEVLEVDKYAESVVRLMLGRVSANCPINVLRQLAETLIRCRKDELQSEAESN